MRRPPAFPTPPRLLPDDGDGDAWFPRGLNGPISQLLNVQLRFDVKMTFSTDAMLPPSPPQCGLIDIDAIDGIDAIVGAPDAVALRRFLQGI